MGPYEIAARTYFDAGFSPLPAIGKLLYVKGFSGRYPTATLEQVERWIKTIGDRNIALRLPKNVIALDIDAYKDDLIKLKELEHDLGPLPITWNSDSRGGEGGKLLYQVPELDKWKSNINGITVIQHTHRYVMAFPSHNKESNSRYRWHMGLGGLIVPDYEIPEITDLPILPDSWVKELEKEEEANQFYDSDAGLYLSDLEIFPDGPPCSYMQKTIESCVNKLVTSYSGGLHDTGLSVLGKLMSTATNGHTGIVSAVEQVSNTFLSSGRKRDLANEWNNLLSFVLAHVSIDSISQIDSCDMKIKFMRAQPLRAQTMYEEIAELDSGNLSIGGVGGINSIMSTWYRGRGYAT